MSLQTRLERLEGSVRGSSDTDERESHEMQQWLARARLRRRDALSQPDADHARSLIALFQTQNRLEYMDEVELVERILGWNPQPENGRSRPIVKREVYLAIYRGEEGARHMTCPPAWRKAFAAGEELLRRYEAIPDEAHARSYVELGEIAEEDEEARTRWKERYEYACGLTEELAVTAIGPDLEDVATEECERRLEECLAPAIHGEKGYRVARLMENMESVVSMGSTGSVESEPGEVKS
ncbi:MAG: hypothetical protein ACFB50_11890 [Rubrobacteraceae bacterium]